jgi:hypothetical protein
MKTFEFNDEIYEGNIKDIISEFKEILELEIYQDEKRDVISSTVANSHLKKLKNFKTLDDYYSDYFYFENEFRKFVEKECKLLS